MAIHPSSPEDSAATSENSYIGDLYVPDVFNIDAEGAGPVSMILMRHPALADLNLSGPLQSASTPSPPSSPLTEATRAVHDWVAPAAPEEEEEEEEEEEAISPLRPRASRGVYTRGDFIITASGPVRMPGPQPAADPASIDFSHPLPSVPAPPSPSNAGWERLWRADAFIPIAVTEPVPEDSPFAAAAAAAAEEDEEGDFSWSNVLPADMTTVAWHSIQPDIAADPLLPWHSPSESPILASAWLDPPLAASAVAEMEEEEGKKEEEEEELVAAELSKLEMDEDHDEEGYSKSPTLSLPSPPRALPFRTAASSARRSTI